MGTCKVVFVLLAAAALAGACTTRGGPTGGASGSAGAKADRAEEPAGLKTDLQELPVRLIELNEFDERVDIEFEGTLAELAERGLDTENANATLQYSTAGFAYALNDPEAVARAVWTVLLDDPQVTAPYPCGYQLDGDIATRKYHSWDEGFATPTAHFEMTGTGDGGGDTCEGGGGPGWWETRVEATFDYATQSGEIRLYAGSE